jgi:hypothetical protein
VQLLSGLRDAVRRHLFVGVLRCLVFTLEEEFICPAFAFEERMNSSSMSTPRQA